MPTPLAPSPRKRTTESADGKAFFENRPSLHKSNIALEGSGTAGGGVVSLGE